MARACLWLRDADADCGERRNDLRRHESKRCAAPVRDRTLLCVALLRVARLLGGCGWHEQQLERGAVDVAEDGAELIALLQEREHRSLLARNLRYVHARRRAESDD
eukprot:2818053-Pleurochrysis_carterae.AAC.1